MPATKIDIMTDINNLFFELIQVALGTRICLSHTPRADEWGELYSMAKKLSLVGVCFAGVQKLVDSEKEDYCGMNELQKRLSADGFRNYIMKG